MYWIGLWVEARVASAKSNKEVQELIAGSSTSSALSAFEAMEEKVHTPLLHPLTTHNHSIYNPINLNPPFHHCAPTPVIVNPPSHQLEPHL